jgi:dTDP-glucose pyrophosphorylase/CBS domain-containing protein
LSGTGLSQLTLGIKIYTKPTCIMTDDVTPFLVSENRTARQAMEQLEQTAEKIIFVVDAEFRLTGSLTDGDIRRWILSDGDLKVPVGRICNRQPYTVDGGYLPEAVRTDMLDRNLNCVPVLDASRQITRLLFWKELFQGAVTSKPVRHLNLPVVIMAGGKGTRLAPFTNVLPKPLIPVGNQTVIEIIIEQFLPYGLNRFQISVNYKAKILKSFFEELAPSYTVTYLEENEPRGTAGVLRALYAPTAEPIIVTNCDVLIRADYAELVAFHAANNYDLTLVASLKDYHIPYGVCELEKGGGLANITEKPLFSFLVNTGMYVVRRDKLGLIPEEAHCDMPDLMQKIKAVGGRIGVYPVGDKAWIDTGEWPEYRKALESLDRMSMHAFSS